MLHVIDLLLLDNVVLYRFWFSFKIVTCVSNSCRELHDKKSLIDNLSRIEFCMAQSTEWNQFRFDAKSHNHNVFITILQSSFSGLSLTHEAGFLCCCSQCLMSCKWLECLKTMIIVNIVTLDWRQCDVLPVNYWCNHARRSVKSGVKSPQNLAFATLNNCRCSSASHRPMAIKRTL